MAAISQKAISNTALSKYDELRLKTDRQLIRLANTELDLGLRDAREALQSPGNWASARARYLLAERALMQAARLLRLTGGSEEAALKEDRLREVELREVEVREVELRSADARLAHLREVLEGLAVLGGASLPAGENTPALARALWKAKGCPDGSAEEDWLQAERVLQSHAVCAGS